MCVNFQCSSSAESFLQTRRRRRRRRSQGYEIHEKSASLFVNCYSSFRLWIMHRSTTKGNVKAVEIRNSRFIATCLFNPPDFHRSEFQRAEKFPALGGERFSTRTRAEKLEKVKVPPGGITTLRHRCFIRNYQNYKEKEKGKEINSSPLLELTGWRSKQFA